MSQNQDLLSQVLRMETPEMTTAATGRNTAKAMRTPELMLLPRHRATLRNAARRMTRSARRPITPAEILDRLLGPDQMASLDDIQNSHWDGSPGQAAFHQRVDRNNKKRVRRDRQRLRRWHRVFKTKGLDEPLRRACEKLLGGANAKQVKGIDDIVSHRLKRLDYQVCPPELRKVPQAWWAKPGRQGVGRLDSKWPGRRDVGEENARYFSDVIVERERIQGLARRQGIEVWEKCAHDLQFFRCPTCTEPETFGFAGAEAYGRLLRFMVFGDMYYLGDVPAARVQKQMSKSPARLHAEALKNAA